MSIQLDKHLMNSSVQGIVSSAMGNTMLWCQAGSNMYSILNMTAQNSHFRNLFNEQIGVVSGLSLLLMKQIKISLC